MTDTETHKEVRLHIGNISSRLQSTPEQLTSRLAKFGTITRPLEFHTKPLGDHYFGYVTVCVTPGDLEKLKKSLHGVVFMGMKLTVSPAKPSYVDRFNRPRESGRGDEGSKTKQEEQLRRDRIVKSRLEKVKEYKTTYPTNNITSTIVPSSSLAPSTRSVSEHTYKNISGNTKTQPAPSVRLNGLMSYGALTTPKKIHDQFRLREGRGQVIRGAHRRTPRSALALRQQTLRILINGELKSLRSYKTKLWGIEKGRTARDLTWCFVNGEWRSGDDHVIERCGISGKQAESSGKDAVVDDEREERKVDVVSEGGEADKNKSILASMFSTFDFDKPVEIDDVKDDDDIEVDSKGRKKAKHYDFEIEGKISDDEEDSQTVEKIDVESANQIIHDYTTNERPAKEQYYDEDDEGNDIEMDEFTEKFTTEAIKDKYDEEHQQDEEESSSEEEFMPTFGAPKPAVNDTETLRTLFNPTSISTTTTPATSFKLGLDEDDEDLDTEKQIDTAEQEQLFQEIQRQKQDEIILAKQQKYGLFWPHFDSPFLSTQSQLSKLRNEKIVLPGEQEGGDDEGESAYEKWFWSMRGEISRECKRRKRDVLRSLRKKSNHR